MRKITHLWGWQRQELDAFFRECVQRGCPTRGVPNAILFVTPNFNPGGTGGTYDPHPVGVWYATSSGQWAVFNEDGAIMPLSAAFNVLAF